MHVAMKYLVSNSKHVTDYAPWSEDSGQEDGTNFSFHGQAGFVPGKYGEQDGILGEQCQRVSEILPDKGGSVRSRLLEDLISSYIFREGVFR